jgi:hypothetical protein
MDLIIILGYFLAFLVSKLLYKCFKTWTSMTSNVNEENSEFSVLRSVWCFVLDEVYEMIMLMFLEVPS